MAAQLPTHLHGFDQYFDGKERPESAIHCHLNKALKEVEKQCSVAKEAIINAKIQRKKKGRLLGPKFSLR